MWSSNIVGGGIDLTWESANAANCEASGAWVSATKAVTGTERIPDAQIGDTFALTCSNNAGATSVAMVTVVDKAVELTWLPADLPPEAVAGYTIHYGTRSGVYPNSLEVASDAESQVLAAGAGKLYIVMTTTHVNGAISDQSTELTLNIQ